LCALEQPLKGYREIVLAEPWSAPAWRRFVKSRFDLTR